MAISDIQKIDYLWKKIGYGVSKSDVESNKGATNEAIASPLLLRSDKIWGDAADIPSVLPATSANPVTVYIGANAVECTEDGTASARRTWLTGSTDWIPTEFGATYNVKVYADSSGAADPTSTGTQLFAVGAGNNDEWFFDYQAGTVHFIGTNLPSVLTASKVIYVVGAVYSGAFGPSASGGTQFGGVIIGGGDGGTEITTPPGEDLDVGAGGSGDTNIGGGGGSTNIGDNVTIDPNGNLQLDQIAINGNRITTLHSNANLELVAAGTGIIDVLSDMTVTGLTVSDLDDQGIVIASANGELTTTADVTWNGTTLEVDGSVTAESFISDGTGTPTLESATNIVFDAGNAVIAEISSTEVARFVSTGLEITQGGITTPTLTVSGNTELGDANSDTITLNAVLASDLIPSGSNTLNIGSSSAYWSEGYITTLEGTDATFTTFTGDLVGNADTATALATARNITLQGDVTGTASFDGSANAILTTTIELDSIVLGDDTTGNYVETIADDGNGTLVLSGSGLESAAVTIGLNTTSVSTGTYGSATAIPSFTVDNYGRLTSASEINVATELNITDGTNNDTISLLTDTLTFEGTALETEVVVSNNKVTVGLPSTVEITTNLTVGNDLFVDGNLTVSGSTTTVDTTVMTLEDPVIRLGVSNLSANDNKDRGNEFLWHNGAASKRGFFGFDTSTGKFTFIPDAVNTGEVFSGNAGDAVFGTVTADLVGDVTGNVTGNVTGTAGSWGTARTITLGGDLEGNVAIDGSANVTLTATVGENAVLLGTDTTGNYAEDITVSGVGLSVAQVAGEAVQYEIVSNATDANTASTIVARDASGDFTAGTITADLVGNADSATEVTITANPTANENVFLVFADSSATGTNGLEVDNGLSYNPAGGIITSTSFAGNLIGDVKSTGGQTVLDSGSDGTNAFFKGDVKATGGTTVLNSGTNGNDATFTGDVTGDLTGNVVGDVVGDLTGDTTGYHLGDVQGSVFGDNSTLLVDGINNVVTAALQGDLTGDVLATDGTRILDNGTDGTDAVLTGNVVGDVEGNADTATALETARNFSITGDVVATAVSFDGTGNVILNGVIQENSVDLGTDTVGDYVEALVAGTGVTITNNTGEGATPTITIGQAVGTTDDVEFNNVTVGGTLSTDDITAATVTASGDVVISGDLTVSGTTTTVNTEEIKLADNLIELNSNLGAGVAPTQDAGLLINRGSVVDVQILWNETTDKFEFKDAAGTPVYQTVKAATFEGAVTGDITGDLVGDVYANNGTSKILENGTDGTDATFTGDVTGDLTGDVTGDVTGDLTGDVTGDVTSTGTSTFTTIDVNGGTIDGVAINNSVIGATTAAAGNFTTIDATGDITGDTVGVHTGAVVGNVVGNLTGDVFASNGTSKVLENGTDGSDATFTGDVTGDVTGNADTATILATARSFNLTGDVTSDTVTFDGSGNVSLTTTFNPGNLVLGTDTTGDYVESLVAGTGVTITNNTGEGATPTLAIGQSVGTTDNVTFNNITASGTLNTDDITASTVTASGNVVITGNLTVNGNTTTINSTTLDVDDINITVAKGTTDSSTANGAGLTIDLGSNGEATLVWNHVGQHIAFNKPVSLGANQLSGDVVGDIFASNGTSKILENGTDGTDAVFTGNVTGDLTGDVTGDVTGNAATASKWQTARTVTFATGDVTGSFSIDGSADVSNVALTIGANSVALGTDTTGDYIESISATSGHITITGGSGESSTPVLSLPNSGVTAATYGSTTAIPVITVDAQGRITTVTTQSITTSIGLSDGSNTDVVAGGETITFTGGTGLASSVSNNEVTFNLDALGVDPSGTYGSATAIPVLTVDIYGRVTGVSTAALVETLDITDGTNSTVIDLLTETLTVEGTADEIAVTVSDNKIAVSLPDDVTIGNDLTVTNDIDITRDATVGRNLVVTGNITAGGTLTYTELSGQDIDASGTISAAFFETDQIRIDDNIIETYNTNTDLELRAAGTGSVSVVGSAFETSANATIGGILEVTGDSNLTTTDINGTLTVSGVTTLNGDVVLGDNAASDTVNFSNATLLGDLVPNADSAIDLGSSTNYFANAYIDDVTVSNDLLIAGNLTVQGATTTVESTVTTTEDPVLRVGVSGLSASDGKDRGIEFLWWDSAARTGFFGLDEGTGRFSFIPNATNTSEVFTGTLGDAQFNRVYAAVTGNITGQVSDISNFDTDDLSEGSTNQYFTQARARTSISATDAGGFGSFAYDNSTGALTYTGPSAADIRGNFSAGGDLSYTEATGLFSVTTYKTADFLTDFGNQDTDDLSEGSTNLYFTNLRATSAISLTDTGGIGSMTYNSATGVITYNGPTDAEVRGKISAGGDLSYDNSTGVMSFTERTDAEVRGLISAADPITYNSSTGEIGFDNTNAQYISLNDLSAGTGVTIASGEISIGQAVGTTDNVTFNNVTVSGQLATDDITAATVTASGNVIISGNLTVSGTTTTLNTSELAVEDINITVANGAADAAAANGAGLTVDGASATLTYTNADDRWNLNKDLNVANVYGDLTGDVTGTVSDISNHSTTDLSEGTNLYYTDVRVRAAVSAGGDLAFDDSTGVFSVTTYKTADFTTDLAAASVDGISDVDISNIKPGQYLRYGGSFGDTSYADTLILIPANGSEDATTFLDESTISGAITANGDAKITQTVKKFGTGSYLGNGTNSYLSATRTAIGSGDFTIDFWIYHDSSVSGYIYSADDATLFQISGSLGVTDSTGNILTSTSLTPNTWYYVSFTRIDGTLYRHINGTLSASAAYTRDLTATDWNIGGNPASSNGSEGYVNGNIDDFRITTSARYGSGNFVTPERAAYTFAGSIGTAFENVTPEINDLVDIDTTGVLNGETLIYDSASDTFKPGTSISIASVTNDLLVDGTLTINGTIFGSNTIELDDITISGNQIRTTASNADLELSVAGTGAIELLESTNITGDATVSGTIDIDGLATLAEATVEDLTINQIVVPAAGGRLNGSSNLTYDGTTFVVGANKLTVASASGDTAIAGTLDVTGEATLASAIVSDLTEGRVMFVGANGALVDAAGFTFDGTTLTVPEMSSASGSSFPSLAVGDLTDNRIIIAGTNGELEDSAQLTFDSSLLTVDAAATITGNLQVNGNVDLGLTTSQTITFGGRVDSNIVPSATNTYDLGTDALRWNDLYLNGSSIHLGNVTLSVDQNGLQVSMFGGSALMDLYNDTTYSNRVDVGDILIDTNVIQTTISNTDLEIRTNGSGTIELQDSTNVTGALDVSTTLNVQGASTLATAKISDLTDGRVLLAGTDGEVEDSGNLTFTSDTLAVTGDATVSGTINVDGVATVAGSVVEDLTQHRVPVAGTGGRLIDSANFTFSSDTLGLNGTLNVTGQADIDDITINGTTIGTTTGGLTIDPDTAGVGGTVTIAGNLTVQGTTTTVDSTTVTIDDPVFTLGGDTAPSVNDSKDKGIEFRWHNGTDAKIGFFGYDESTGRFTFKPDSTNSSEIFSGNAGDAEFNDLYVQDLTVNSIVTSGDLAVEHGGTGVSTLTSKGILYGNGTGDVQVTAAAGDADASTSNQILTTDGSGVPVWTDTIDEGTF
jgi:hypothetical protein